MTNPLTLAAVRAIKSEAEKATQAPWVEHYGAVMHIDGGLAHYLPQQSNQPKIDAAFMAHARTNVPALCDSYVTLVEALRLMHDERVHFHMEDAGHNDEKQECCFCTFGDRAENDIIECSYCKVKAILATIDRPSAEAQTEGDGG